MTDWERKILSRIKPTRRHGSIYRGPARYQDNEYAAKVAANIKQRKEKT